MEEWPSVSGSQSIPEECGANPAEGERYPDPEQHGPVARGARPAQPHFARLVELLQLRDPGTGLSGGRSPRRRSRALVSEAAPSSSVLSMFSSLEVKVLYPT